MTTQVHAHWGRGGGGGGHYLFADGEWELDAALVVLDHLPDVLPLGRERHLWRLIQELVEELPVLLDQPHQVILVQLLLFCTVQELSLLVALVLLERLLGIVPGQIHRFHLKC